MKSGRTSALDTVGLLTMIGFAFAQLANASKCTSPILNMSSRESFGGFTVGKRCTEALNTSMSCRTHAAPGAGRAAELIYT